MKKFLAILLTVVMALSMVASASASSVAGTYDITIWAADKVVDLFRKQVEEFNNTNTLGIKFNAVVEAVDEGTAASKMIADVTAGADIFCFAQDQFARLVQAGALKQLGKGAAETVTNNNIEEAIAAATSGEALYAYPMTADNGYFMYYDKSVIPEADIDSLEAIIADCEANQKYIAFNVLGTAFYTPSFFFGTGCVSKWITDDDGNFISINDDFNSAKGLIAAKGMKKLVSSPMLLNSNNGTEFAAGAAVVVSGIWDYETVAEILGDNMGVADLPSFEVDGNLYHIGSFRGCKLLGIKPQDDTVRAAALNQLALYLTNKDCQLERFEKNAWGPSNIEAREVEAVKVHPGLAALEAQRPYAAVQGQIHGSWWDICKVIADDVKNADDEAGLQAALDNYYNKIDALFQLDTSALLFVGAWNGWNNADDADTYYFKDDVLTLDVPESDYMGGRIVSPGSWDTDKGFAQVTVGADLIKDLGADNPDNNIVFAEPGNYTITLNGAAIEIVKN